MEQRASDAEALGTDDNGLPPELWSPAGIALWSVLLTPAFGALAQMYNHRRLGETALAETSRRWCVAGFAVLAWSALSCAFGQRLGMEMGLFGWTNVAMLAAWMGATMPAHAQLLRERCGDGYKRRQWDSMAVLGLFAALAFQAASSVLRWFVVNLT